MITNNDKLCSVANVSMTMESCKILYKGFSRHPIYFQNYQLTRKLFTFSDPDKNFHYVVNCGAQVMKEHCYWPLVSDLNNVLSHRPVAVKFMSDDNLLEIWFAFLSMFQGKKNLFLSLSFTFTF